MMQGRPSPDNEAATATEESRARLNSVAANLSGVIYRRIDHAEGGISYPFVSDSVRSVYGYEPSEIMRNPQIFAKHSAVDQSQYDIVVAEAARDLKPYAWVGQEKRRSGQTFWAQIVGRPRRLDNGDIVWDAVILDITEQHNAQQALLETTQFFESLAANVPGVIFQRTEKSDGTMFFSYVSPSALRIYGYTAAECMREPSLFSEKVIEDLDSVRKVRDEARRTMRPYVWTGRQRRKDGSLFWSRTSARPRRMANGDTIWDGIVLDITDVKRAEAQVVQAAKLATVGEMAASLTHELNQPLNIIRMAADAGLILAEEGTKNADFLLEQTRVISDQVSRMAEIIEHMSVFSRKADPAAAVTFDPTGNLRNCVRFLAKEMRNANVELEIVLPESSRTIRGQPIQLEQVVVNLLSNARDAIVERRARDGEAAGFRGAIRLSLSHDGERLVIEVQDNGGGIPASALPHVFEPFFTTKKAGKGTGLGLSVGDAIIKAMGGALTAVNKGDGACFTIQLPVTATQEDGRGKADGPR
ncbi:MAG: ATP-binding protein [Alphaproteobacteria bacterium]